MSTPDDFKEIEAMIADLPTREPSPMLDARIASTLKAGRRSRMPLLAIAAAVLLAAAVTLVIVLSPASTQQEAQQPLAIEQNNPPVDASVNPPDNSPQELPKIVAVNNPTRALDMTWTRDVLEETRYTPAGQPYRAVVREAVDHKAWFNSETGETSQLRVPREELVVIKQTLF